MNETSQNIPGRWGRRKRDIGIAIWIAFLSACVGTFVIFAVMDPEALNDAWVLPWEMGSRLAYSLGFAFLFIVSLMKRQIARCVQGLGTHPRRQRAE